jgi:hypothetical protein
MELTRQQKGELFKNGFVKIPRVIPEKNLNVALRAINHSLGTGINPRDVPEFRANSFCPELRNRDPIIDLLIETPLWKLVESATERGKIKLSGGGQIALRFPVMEVPGELHPHLDGLYRPGNKVPKGKIQSFTMLAGVYLSDVPNRYWGNFTAWPGTHRSFEKYFQEHGPETLLQGLPKIKMPEPVQLLGRAGDVFLCHYQLAHTVVVNVSPYIRYAVFFRLSHIYHDAHADKVFTDIWLEWPGIKEAL